jgi:hypothetical protein
VESVDTGLATNLESGEILTFVTPPAGITAAATLVEDLDGGADTELDPEGRARLVAYVQDPPASGNVADWRESIESAAQGALRAYVWPQRQNQPYGWGTTDYCAFQIGEHGLAMHVRDPSDLWTAIETAVESTMPVLLMYDSRQLEIVSFDIVVEVSVELADYATDADRCDWDAEATKHTVSAYHVANRTITANSDINTELAVGDRVIINCAQGIVDKVGVVDGLAANTMFRVSTWFTQYDADENPYPWDDGFFSDSGYDPTGDEICSGGGRILALIGGLRDYMSSRGPAKGAYAAPIVGWDDVVRLHGLQSAVVGASDSMVVACTVVLPAADTAPAVDAATNVDRIVASQIVVWEEKP